MSLGLGLGLGLNLGLLTQQLSLGFNMDTIINDYNDPNVEKVIIRQKIECEDLAFILMNLWAEKYLDKYKDDSIEIVEIDLIGCDGLLCLLEKIYEYTQE